MKEENTKTINYYSAFEIPLLSWKPKVSGDMYVVQVNTVY